MGERFCQPDLARSLRLLAEQGPDAFYRGPIAQAIASTIARHGALLTAEDLAAHTSTWVEPLSTDYHGLQVWECPPNGQGIVALEALNILSGVDLAGMPFDAPDTVHWKIEALKLALADALGYVADPEHVRVPVDELLSPEHAARRRAEIDLQRATPNPLPGLDLGNDTVYATAVDGEGNAASIINSIFLAFGSGLVAEGTGICLQNRGHLFVMDPEHPNCIAPNKRPFHTIIPCMATQNGDLRMSFGVMGGAMQPQGHVQVLTNMLDHGMDVQAAIDAPRFYYQPGSTHLIEPYFADETLAELRRRGHDFTVDEGGIFGGAQIILVDPDSGALVCGSGRAKTAALSLTRTAGMREQPWTRFALASSAAAASCGAPSQLQKLSDVQLVAVADIAPGKAEETAGLHAIPAATDHNEMLAKRGLDAVSVCTPNAFHKAPTIAALQAGATCSAKSPSP